MKYASLDVVWSQIVPINYLDHHCVCVGGGEEGGWGGRAAFHHFRILQLGGKVLLRLVGILAREQNWPSGQLLLLVHIIGWLPNILQRQQNSAAHKHCKVEHDNSICQDCCWSLAKHDR